MSPFISRLMLPTQETAITLHEFQDGFLPLVGGVIIAIVLSFFLRETGLAGETPHMRKGSVAAPQAAGA